MTSSRQEYVVAFWKNSCSPVPTTSLRSAIAGGLLSCLSFDELLELLVSDSATDGRLRQKVLARAADAFDQLPATARRKAARRVLQLTMVTPYARRLTLEYLLELLYTRIPSPSRRVILRMFLESRMYRRRKRAYRMMRQDRRIRWKPMLAKAWRAWRDRDAAHLIVDQFESAFLLKHLEKLASDLDGGAGIPKLFLRVASEGPSVLAQLRKCDGITYGYVCARLSKAISVLEAKSLLKKYKDDARLGILVWSLGKLGHWNLLIDLSEEVEDIERKQQRQHYERMGLSSETIRSLPVQPFNSTEANNRLEKDVRLRSQSSWTVASSLGVR
jgi:hypothetical protein